MALISDALRRRERAQAKAVEQGRQQDVAAAAQGDYGAIARLLQTTVDEFRTTAKRIETLHGAVVDLNARFTALTEVTQRLQREPPVAAPAEVQIIREPAAQPVAASPPSPQPAASSVAEPPDPPRIWDMRVMARDPNGAIAHIRWTPQDG